MLNEVGIVALVFLAILWGVSILGGVALGGYLVHMAHSGKSVFSQETQEGEIIEEPDLYAQYAAPPARTRPDILPGIIQRDEDYAAPDVSAILAEQNARFRAQMSEHSEIKQGGEGGNHGSV